VIGRLDPGRIACIASAIRGRLQGQSRRIVAPARMPHMA